MSDEPTRCTWCLKDEAYIKYHDEAWGIPVHDDIVHFEYLALEAAQAGLSWHTILIRMEGYRKAFSNWDIDQIENYDNDKILELLQFEGIIRNRKKIEAVIHNVKPVINEIKTIADYASSSPLSDQISKDLKNRGFKFIGTTTTYAYMQAIGLVNDHMESCWKK